MAVFVGIVTPPLLISKALKLSGADEAYLVGIGPVDLEMEPFCNAAGLGRVGYRVVEYSGNEFPLSAGHWIGPTVMAKGGSPENALGVVFGTCLVAAIIPIFIRIGFASKVITPLRWYGRWW